MPSPPLPSLIASSSLTSFLLKKCAATLSLDRARRLHGLLLTSLSAFEATDPFVHNNILSMYARCGSLIDSHRVFDKMPHRSIVSYNSIILSYSRNQTYSLLAFDVLHQMRYLDCLRPNGGTFVGLLQAASKCLGNYYLGLELHGLIVKSGVLNDAFVLTTLLGCYTNCGELESAIDLFTFSSVKDSTTWNCIISGSLKNGAVKDCLVLFNRMMASGFNPTEFTYSMVLKACGKLEYHDFGRLIHARVIVTQVPIDLPLQNALIDMYSSCGDSGSAYNVFCRIVRPDRVAFNSMILAFSEDRDGENAILLYTQMLKLHNVKPDEYSFAAVVSAVGDDYLAASYGKPLHALLIKFGLESSVYVASPLISVYFANGMVDYAEQVFHTIHSKDLVLWTKMISGYAKVGNGENAFRLFYQMFNEGHKADSFVLSSALNGCADLTSLYRGQMIHGLSIRVGCAADVSVCGSLIDMYAKNGDLGAARNIYSEMSRPDLQCCNAMIGACSHHGRADEALELFLEILNQGLQPDPVSFVSVLSVCDHCGLVEVGKYLWQYMKENKLSPGPKHYSCMVSLLGRAELFKEAEEIIYESPSNSNCVELWRTLLSSSIAKKNLEVGLHAAQKILAVDAEDSSTHVLLSNLYAVVGKWDCVMETRKRIRGLMIEKDPGLSWIEVGKKFEVFSSGDLVHPEIIDVQAQLHMLQYNMVEGLNVNEMDCGV